MNKSRNVAWAEYTGNMSPFGDRKPCWCAWQNDLPLFITTIGNIYIAAVGGEQIQLPPDVDLIYAQTFVTSRSAVIGVPTDITRAHILNFQKKG